MKKGNTSSPRRGNILLSKKRPRSEQKADKDEPYCACGENSIIEQLEVKKEGANQGRKFFTCRQCEGFLWDDKEGDRKLWVKNKKFKSSDDFDVAQLSQLKDLFAEQREEILLRFQEDMDQTSAKIDDVLALQQSILDELQEIK